MPDEVQPAAQPATPTVTDVALGLKSNTLAQYGILGILAVAGPWLWSQAKDIHTTAVQTSADRFEKAAKTAAEVAKSAEDDRKTSREQFVSELKTILKDSKDERKESREQQEKSNERVWGRVGKLSEALESNTKEQRANTVAQQTLVVELREHRFERPAKAVTPKGANP